MVEGFNLTTKGRVVIQQYGKDNVKNRPAFQKVDVNMTKNGSIIVQQKKTPKSAPAIQTQTSISASQITDAMGLLNKTLSGFVKTKSSDDKSTSNSNVNADAAPQQSSPSGIASGVSGAGSYSGLDASPQNINSIANNLDSSDAITLRRTIDNDINPMVSNANLALSSAKADYSVLQGQKDQAEADVSNLQQGIQTSSAQKEEAQKSLDNNKSSLDASVQARDKMDEQLSGLNEEYGNICSDVKEKENAKSQCQNSVSQCKSGVTTAETEFKSASSAYDSAKNVLDNTPETLEDGTPNPEYAATKTACDNALSVKEKAEQALETAKNELEKAEGQLTQAEENLTTAQDQKKDKLTQIKNTDSKCTKLAETCEKTQNQVEMAQEGYDTSLENFDTCNNNYEKMNSELESTQGIITQCGEYEDKIKELQYNAEKANALKEKALKAYKDKDVLLLDEVTSEVEETKYREIKKEIQEHAGKSEGCSASKSPAENLLSMKDGPRKIQDRAEFAENGLETSRSYGVTKHNPVITADKSYFEEIGCMANSDGSFTNPENGETYVNVEGRTWVNTLSISNPNHGIQVSTSSVDNEIIKAGLRGNDQMNGHRGNINPYIRLDKNTGRAVLK